MLAGCLQPVPSDDAALDGVPASPGSPAAGSAVPPASPPVPSARATPDAAPAPSPTAAPAPPEPTPDPTPDPAPTPPAPTPSPAAPTPDPTPAPTTEPTAAPAPEVRRLDVSVWDRTSALPPRDAQVLVNGTVWQPYLRHGVDGPRDMGGFPVGENHTIVVRPDGVASNECAVTFRMRADMVDGTNGAETTVEVHDTFVAVSGAAIPEGTRSCLR